MLELLVLAEWVQGGLLFLPYCRGPTYHAAQNIELVAGSDLHQEQAELFAERWGIDHDHIYNNHREMLKKESLDIVSILYDSQISSKYCARCCERRN